MGAVAFDMFDVSGSGCVGEEDLVVILSKGAGSNMSPQQLQTVRTPATAVLAPRRVS